VRSNPERLAWIVLLLSFSTCVSLTVGVPLGIRHYVLYAYVGQNVTLDVQQGPLRVTLAGRGEPVAIAEERDGIPERTIVATDSTAGRLVIRAPQADGPVIATVQIYDNTEVVLSSARSPRFPASHLPHKLVLEVATGWVRVGVSSDDGRSTVVEVHTPHGRATLTEGSYEVKLNGTTTEVTVRDGRADVMNNAKQVTPLGPAERATIDDRQIIGPLPAHPDLIADGDFAAPAGEENWDRYSVDPEIEGESRGEVQRAAIEGQPVIVIERRGVGHAETGIRQELDADIRAFSFLQLHLLLRVEEHNVPVCGSYGSECPVMVRLDYQDAYGTDREWLQGFYYLPDPSGSNPPVCVTCSTRNEHIQVPEDTWYAYASPNLLPLLSQDGQAPTAIKSITVYASGHVYQSAITEVELIGQE